MTVSGQQRIKEQMSDDTRVTPVRAEGLTAWAYDPDTRLLAGRRDGTVDG
jgi:hypothetical protein